MSAKKPFMRKEARESPGFLLWQVSMVWQRKISSELRSLELTQTQFVLLASLLWLSKPEEQVSQANLARHTRMDPMTVSQVLRTLEKRGLVAREAHRQDSRANALRLTPAGEALARKAVPRVESADEAFFAPLGLERPKVISIMKTLVTEQTEGEE